MKSRALLSAALVGVALLTRPGANSFRRALISWVRKQQGILGQAIARGVLALDQLSAAQLHCKDFKCFSYVQLKPEPRDENGAPAGTLLADLFDNDAFFGAVGVFGHWFAVRIPEGGLRDDARVSSLPQIFLLGSALS